VPLYDQEGRQTNENRVQVLADVRTIVVRHTEVEFLDDAGKTLVKVDRPTYPGAGLGVEVDDEILVT